MKAEFLKKFEKIKQKMEEKTGQICKIEESEDDPLVKCSGTTSGSNIISGGRNAELIKKLEKMKQEMEEKTGQTCEIEESEDGHAVKCSGTTSGSKIFSGGSYSTGKVLIIRKSNRIFCSNVQICQFYMMGKTSGQIVLSAWIMSSV